MSHKIVPPANDFWLRKIHYYFNEVLDANSDGVINSSDIELFRNLYRQMKNLSVDSPALIQFSHFLDTWFKAIMRADTNGNNDGNITLQEFVNYCATIRQQLYGRTDLPESLRYLKDYLIALFHILDTDSDGLISKHDYIAAYSDFEEASERETYWAYICRTENNDNITIDEDTFTKLCIEFLCSTDPEDRGNYLFGLF